MKILYFMVIITFASCHKTSKGKVKSVRYKPGDGGIEIRPLEVPSYAYEDDISEELFYSEPYLADDYSYPVAPAYPVGRGKYKYKYKAGPYKVIHKDKTALKAKWNAKKVSKLNKSIQKHMVWLGKKMVDYAAPGYGYGGYGYADPSQHLVTVERPVYQPAPIPQLVEVRVPKCKPSIKVPHSVTNTLIKKERVTITRTKVYTKTIKEKEYVVNTQTVTQHVTPATVTVTRRPDISSSYGPPASTYGTPASSRSYRDLVSSLRDLLLE